MIDSAFSPDRLRLARELKAWSQADLSVEVGLTAAAVSQFESGATHPGAESVARMAGALEVPEEFFGLPLVDTHEGFFRSLRRTSVSHRRRARALAHVAHDVAVAAGSSGAIPGLAIPRLRALDLNAGRAEVEKVAGEVRREWRLPDGPVPNVVELLEDKGIVVIRLPLASADVDAFSLPFPDRPVVVLGSDKNDRARSRFDAAHELGHLVAHSDQVWAVKEVETQAHWFAAAFLMPAGDIFDQLPSRADWPTLFELKRTWQVSLAALLMRARSLGKMSEGNYLTAVKAPPPGDGAVPSQSRSVHRSKRGPSLTSSRRAAQTKSQVRCLSTSWTPSEVRPRNNDVVRPAAGPRLGGRDRDHCVTSGSRPQSVAPAAAAETAY